jgi:mannose-1-phosphate guanylyltransferase
LVIQGADIFAVLIAGGKGTRFWPRSRSAKPKQFLPILSDKTLLQETAERIAPLVPLERTYVVTGKTHVREVNRQLPLLKRSNILAEPEGRNTAPAIGLAAMEISKFSPEAVMIVLPSDHAIQDSKRFLEVARVAIRIAEKEEALVTIGIKPTYPETGYGYIKKGNKAFQMKGVQAYQGAGFKEKPTLRVAERFVKSKVYLWNSGIFAWKTKVILKRIHRWLPQVYLQLEEMGGRSTLKACQQAYQRMPSVSIDKGVLEREKFLWLVEADFAWSDVGNWARLGDLWRRVSKDSCRGRIITIGSHGVVAYSPERLLVLLGVKNLIVVDSEDAILVADRGRAQDVGKVVTELERRGQTFYL